MLLLKLSVEIHVHYITTDMVIWIWTSLIPKLITSTATGFRFTYFSMSQGLAEPTPGQWGRRRQGKTRMLNCGIVRCVTAVSNKGFRLLFVFPNPDLNTSLKCSSPIFRYYWFCGICVVTICIKLSCVEQSYREQDCWMRVLHIFAHNPY